MKRWSRCNVIRCLAGVSLPIVLAACAPEVTYHWEQTRPRTEANLAADGAECRGYAEQFRRAVVQVQPAPAAQTPRKGQLYEDNSAVYAGLAAASATLAASQAESSRIQGIYLGCMARLGWVLTRDELVKK